MVSMVAVTVGGVPMVLVIMPAVIVVTALVVVLLVVRVTVSCVTRSCWGLTHAEFSSMLMPLGRRSASRQMYP